MGTWQHWVNAILGLWVLAVPFFFAVTDSALMWTLVISGLVVAVLGIWGANETASTSERSTRMASSQR